MLRRLDKGLAAADMETMRKVAGKKRERKRSRRGPEVAEATEARGSGACASGES